MNRHLMLKSLLLVVLVGWVAGTAQAGPPPDGYMNFVTATPIVYEGTPAWEYYYDVYSGGLGSATQICLHGFDANDLLNPLNQRWDSSAADGWSEAYWGEFPSYGSPDLTEWVLSGNPGEMINPIHPPSAYLEDPNMAGAFLYPADITGANELHYWYGSYVQYVSGLYMTIRLVHPWGPGNISYSIHGPFWWEQENAPIIGPAPPVPGDFDGIDGVNDIDIDMLCDFIRGSMPYDVLYDISADGVTGGTDSVVDTLDLDYLIRFLVETSLGTGTEYGDFNLDGVIDTTDLTRLATNYGDDDWKWDDGNANRNIDTNIDNTDLTILATYYGFGVPDAVPEPMTLSLLALGTAGLLARRRRRA